MMMNISQSSSNEVLTLCSSLINSGYAADGRFELQYNVLNIMQLSYDNNYACGFVFV